MCCEKVKKDQICEKGALEFATSSTCTQNNDTCEDLGHRCCLSCRLGQKIGESKVTCSSIRMDLGDELERVFQNCCERTNPTGKKWRPNKAPKRKPEEDDYEDYGIPTPVTDNLCDLLPGELCAQICVPTPGSYYCKCNKGYILMEDQKTCQLDKKRSRQPTFPPAVIVPNPEKPVPLHKPRIRNDDNPKPNPNSVPSKQSCAEDNPCAQECQDTARGVRCSCRPGYELDVDQKSCNDVDECLDNIHVCDPEMEVCINEIGGYRCVARGETTLKTTTTTTTPTTTTTTTTTERVEPTDLPTAARCPTGYEPSASGCVDIDECDYDNNPEACDPNEKCLNSPGSYECHCKEGFHRDSASAQGCIDINECQTKQHSCLATQRCDNTIGKCSFHDDFYLEGNKVFHNAFTSSYS